jgi:hypothetical protein
LYIGQLLPSSARATVPSTSFETYHRSGYERLLTALADPKDPEHDELNEWTLAGFDPEACDVAAANRRLRRR